MQNFLPVTKQEMQQRGWDQVDFVYITGDAYVDHPSFGSAIISRLLESRGYRVGIIPQPDWRHKESIQTFGEPRLGFLVTAGNMVPGQSLHSLKETSPERFLFSGRRDGTSAGYANSRIQQPDSSDI